MTERAPEGQFRVAGIVPGLVVHIPLPLGAVPVRAGFVGDGFVDPVHEIGVKGGAHGDGLRIDGVTVGADAVAGLAPPVVGRDAELVHGDGFIHEQADLLLRRQERQEVVDAFFHREGRVLERKVVGLFLGLGGQEDAREGKGK